MNNKINILLAEDDKNLGTILKTYLEAKGFNVHLCEDGEKALDFFSANQNIEFCILDVMMPKKDGFYVAKEIRKSDKTIPILFLTAKSLEKDKLKGFQIGADDYMTKPFSMDELLVRVQAILRRVEPLRKDVDSYKIGTMTFDVTRQILHFGEREQKLTSKESALLTLLCENKNSVLDRSKALLKIWNDDSYFNARSMDVYITKLRKYLKADPSVELINVHGIGFKLIAED